MVARGLLGCYEWLLWGCYAVTRVLWVVSRGFPCRYMVLWVVTRRLLCSFLSVVNGCQRVVRQLLESCGWFSGVCNAVNLLECYGLLLSGG